MAEEPRGVVIGGREGRWGLPGLRAWGHRGDLEHVCENLQGDG